MKRVAACVMLSIAFAGCGGEEAGPAAAGETPTATDAAAAHQTPSGSAPAATQNATSEPVPGTMPIEGAALADASLPLVVVHKNANCGCCHLWVEHMQQAGFQVEVRDVDNLEPVKTRVGVPPGKGSCHTAEIDGYFVEGHVPADDIKRLLAERPDAKGLTVPGMPMGSPGMEVPDGRIQPYTVELVQSDGSTTTFAQYGQ